MTPPVPDFVLERYRLGELPEGEAETLRQRLQSDLELRLRLEALARSDEELRRALPAGLAGRVRERLAQHLGSAVPAGRPAFRLSPVPAAVAVAATVVLAVALRTLAPGSSTVPVAAPPVTGEGEGERTKGLRPALSLFRKTPSGSEALADGDRARRGDVIRVGYRSAGRRYGVIVSLDGRGTVTRHLPERGRVAAALEGGEVVLLTHAYELDDAPAWERFYLVTADEPFEVGAVEEAARRARTDHGMTAAPAPEALRLPKPLEQSSFLLTKETRR